MLQTKSHLSVEILYNKVSIIIIIIIIRNLEIDFSYQIWKYVVACSVKYKFNHQDSFADILSFKTVDISWHVYQTDWETRPLT